MIKTLFKYLRVFWATDGNFIHRRPCSAFVKENKRLSHFAPKSRFLIMGAGKSVNFESAVLDKYATTDKYTSRGAFGNVHGPVASHGSQLAIKQALVQDRTLPDEFKKSIEEMKVIWTSLEHKNLMRIHGLDLTKLPKVMLIVTDFSAGGSLHKTLRSLDPANTLPVNIVAIWAKQIAEGMLYLHERDIIHGDLKSSNIFLMEPFDVRKPRSLTSLKISDFDEVRDHSHTATISTLSGTGPYMTPEVIGSQKFSKTRDIWSYGAVVWEMLSGDIPHEGLQQRTILYKSRLEELDKPSLEQSVKGDFMLIIKRCWESKHAERISFNDISIILRQIGDISGQTLIEELQVGHETTKKLHQTFILPPITRQQRIIILQKIKSFSWYRLPKVSITNCIFEDDYVEFYFVLENTTNMEKSLLINEIVTFLDFDASFAERIRVTQLKSKPTGERTNIGPGSPVKNINARDSTTTLGAFVSIEGKGDHVLSCGHDKTVGDILSSGDNERIGTTRAVTYCTEDGQSYDAALANVDGINYAKSVVYEGRQLHLAPNPVDPIKGTVVQRFPPRSMTSQATIRHIDYNSLPHDICGCFSVITDNREAFHYPGESGLVVTSMPSADFPERVNPLGMLFYREFVEKTDDGRGYFLSLAIPMAKNLEKLQEDEYCDRGQITFLRDT